jgi:hypothetical protein
MEKLGLINYEGDCLFAVRDDGPGEILVVDQYREPVERLTLTDFYKFLEGSLEITDSKGKSWNFANEHREAQAKPADICRFIAYLRYSQEELNDAFVKGWELRHMGLSDELIIHEFVGFLNEVHGKREKRRNT